MAISPRKKARRRRARHQRSLLHQAPPSAIVSLAPARVCLHALVMTSAVVRSAKRERPPTGATPIHLTLVPDQLAALDAWRDAQDPKPSRPEAIRQLLQRTLPAPNTTTIRSEFG